MSESSVLPAGRPGPRDRPPLDPARLQVLREAVAREMPGVRRDLEALVRIPSVSALAFDQAQVQASAQAVAELLRGAGLQDVELLREGGAPAVVGHLPGPDGAPTVLLYAHHDVQPPGEDADWTSAPFEPVERDGRLYGRGAADDKAGVMAHLAAIRAHDGRPPVGVTVFVEGEEESGSPSLGNILRQHRDKLSADVLVLADSTNWKSESRRSRRACAAWSRRSSRFAPSSTPCTAACTAGPSWTRSPPSPGCSAAYTTRPATSRCPACTPARPPTST